MLAHPHRASRLRRLAAVALVVTAAIHVALVPSHLREAPYAGALFIALSVTALTFAVLLATSDHWWVCLGAVGLSATALLAYAASRSLGLPSLNDDVGNWLNPLGVAAALSETATALMCWNAIGGSRALRRDKGRIHATQPTQPPRTA